MPTGIAGFGTTTVIAAGNSAQATDTSEKPGSGRAFCCQNGSGHVETG